METVTELLQRFQMVGVASRRTQSLSDLERFWVMLLRAAVMSSACVVIDRPFRIVPDLQDDGFLLKALSNIDDMIAEAYIFDYTSQQSRYGACQ
jgi:ABC-type molybdenum transport system ATPase subunit/photorepair protein PhrA